MIAACIAYWLGSGNPLYVCAMDAQTVLKSGAGTSRVVTFTDLCLSPVVLVVGLTSGSVAAAGCVCGSVIFGSGFGVSVLLLEGAQTRCTVCVSCPS